MDVVEGKFVPPPPPPLKLGKFPNFKALFPVVLMDLRRLVFITTSNNRMVYFFGLSHILTKFGNSCYDFRFDVA